MSVRGYNLLGIDLDFEEFDKLICEQNKGKQLKVENGKVIAVDYVLNEEEINQQKILQLKEELRKTDYEALKFAEGQISEEEYAPIKQKRQAWRDEINILEE